MTALVQNTFSNFLAMVVRYLISKLSQNTKKTIFIFSLAATLKIYRYRNSEEVEMIEKIKDIFSINLSPSALRAPCSAASIIWHNCVFSDKSGDEVKVKQIIDIMPSCLKYDTTEVIASDVAKVLSAIRQ